MQAIKEGCVGTKMKIKRRRINEYNNMAIVFVSRPNLLRPSVHDFCVMNLQFSFDRHK